MNGWDLTETISVAISAQYISRIYQKVHSLVFRFDETLFFLRYVDYIYVSCNILLSNVPLDFGLTKNPTEFPEQCSQYM